MTCVSEGTLRAYRDGELDPTERLEVGNHLENCPDCRKHSEDLASLAGRVHQHLLALRVPADGLPVEPRVALVRFKVQHQGHNEGASMIARLFARRWRPVWVAGIAIAFLAVCLTFPSARSFAQRVLQTLRVERVQPVSVDTASIEGNDTIRQMIAKMVSDKVVVTIDEKEQLVSTVTAASKLAGFEAYAPTDNVSELTARTNDDGWPTVFVEWLRGSRLNAQDAVLILSVGGGNVEKNVSPNLVSALQYVKEVGGKILGIVGRDGGYTAQVADACVIVPTVNPQQVTPHAEAFQAVVWHLLVSHPRLKTAPTKWEGMA